MLSQKSSEISSRGHVGHVILVGGLKVFTVKGDDLVVGPSRIREVTGGR